MESANMESTNIRTTTRGKLLLGALIVLLLGLCYSSISWFIDKRTYVTTNDAKITGEILGASSRISGKIVDIKVRNGDVVKKGNLLYSMDTGELRARLNRAEAQLKIAKTKLDKAVGGARSQEISAAQTLVDQANAALSGSVDGRESIKTALTSMENTYNSIVKQMSIYKNPNDGKIDAVYAMKQLNTSYIRKGISDIQYTVQAQGMQQLFSAKIQLEAQIAQIKGELKNQEASVESYKTQLKGAENKLKVVKDGTSTNDIEILVNTVKAAQAEYDLARLAFEAAKVRAPNNGTIVQINSHVGDVLTPGISAMSLIDFSKLIVTAYIPEEELERVKVGSEVKVYVDAHPGKSFSGKIKEIGGATSSVFNIFGSDNSLGNYTGVSERVPVKIQFDYSGYTIIPGMSVTAKIKASK